MSYELYTELEQCILQAIDENLQKEGRSVEEAKKFIDEVRERTQKIVKEKFNL